MSKSLDCCLEAFRLYEDLNIVSYGFLNEQELLDIKQLPSNMRSMAQQVGNKAVLKELEQSRYLYSDKKEVSSPHSFSPTAQQLRHRIHVSAEDSIASDISNKHTTESPAQHM